MYLSQIVRKGRMLLKESLTAPMPSSIVVQTTNIWYILVGVHKSPRIHKVCQISSDVLVIS